MCEGGGLHGGPHGHKMLIDLMQTCIRTVCIKGVPTWTRLLFVTYGDLEILVLSMLWWASEDYCISSAIDFPVLDLIILSKSSIHFSDKNSSSICGSWHWQKKSLVGTSTEPDCFEKKKMQLVPRQCYKHLQ